MRRNNLSRSDEDNVQIASSISRAVLINAYDTAGDRAGKGDRHAALISQIAMSSGKHRGAAYRPYAFTEHGALQAANVLRSPRVVQMSIFVIRAFVKMRETLLGTRELAKKLAVLEKKLTARLNVHEAAIVQVLQEVMQILSPPPAPPSPPKPHIGFRPDI
jgi:hypothetical protein